MRPDRMTGPARPKPPAMDADTFAGFLDQLRRFVRERLVPAEAQVIADDRIPDDIVAAMRDMGLFALTAPAKYGGIGMNVSEYIATIRELSWAMPAYRSMISINTGMVNTAIVNGGTEDQKRIWLSRMTAGAVVSFALTEPDSGSDSAGLRTTAKRDGNGYVLNGTKRYITNAPMAEMVLVMARTNAANLPSNAHISAFLVPAGTPGVTIGKPDRKMGQAGSMIADVVLDDVRLPGDALLGGVEGAGFRAAMGALDTGRLSVAAAATGYMDRILDSALRYATERKAFGAPISDFQLIQAMLADSKAELYASDCMLSDAARKADTGARISLEAACTKMFATEACGRVADRAVQIHGGAGYLSEYDAERFYRDVRLYRIYEGTTQIQQLVIAKQMLRQFAEQAG